MLICLHRQLRIGGIVLNTDIMKNPYEILELPQNATVSDIMRAATKAARKRLYPPVEIAQASAQLRKPATRLAADFTFPIFESFDDMKPLSLEKSK